MTTKSELANAVQNQVFDFQNLIQELQDQKAQVSSSKPF